ncbi:homeotic protein ultrabithorax-like [Rhagoletis pomonella]|uniref:homeotic protein ultrabithorax-like n=1 Tax=Rhagoletis pomonella TaxID=28610 RepID=UPI0017869F29|nr:homeotic protein ultrabithorax-like [Rhagoletis pomonella]
MNSYFEQASAGFYGHPHQATGMAMGTGGHHDQTATAAAAAYRGFPLSLGMSPYANHHLQRTTQDSPYDASITAACNKIYSDGAYKQDCLNIKADSVVNGYKDIWNTSANGTSGGGGGSGGAGGSGGGSNGSNANGLNNAAGGMPVRPSACTPDSRVGGYLDTSGGSPVSHRGGSGGGSGGTGVVGGGQGGGGGVGSVGGVGGGVGGVGGAGTAWNANCTISGAAAAQSASSLHQATNHTFYPWMAIAGKIRSDLTQYGGISTDMGKEYSIFYFLLKLLFCSTQFGVGIFDILTHTEQHFKERARNMHVKMLRKEHDNFAALAQGIIKTTLFREKKTL